ncbi:MAG: hypothetical protein ACAH88_04145, partial [Roseimicrobium sp.]
MFATWWVLQLPMEEYERQEAWRNEIKAYIRALLSKWWFWFGILSPLLEAGDNFGLGKVPSGYFWSAALVIYVVATFVVWRDLRRELSALKVQTVRNALADSPAIPITVAPAKLELTLDGKGAERVRLVLANVGGAPAVVGTVVLELMGRGGEVLDKLHTLYATSQAGVL